MQKADPFGNALKDYLKDKKDRDIIVHSDIAEDDVIPVPYLFREYAEMPKLEQTALDMCKGKVLDIGGGSGSHALYLQEKSVDVSVIDISEGAVEVMQARGVQNVILGDINTYATEKYDTLLLLMNGIGLTGTLDGFKQFLMHCKGLLKPDGQIVFDSSDVLYMYEEEDGSVWINMMNEYHGEVEFSMEYNGLKGEPFKWLYLDYGMMVQLAEQCGYKAELIAEGEHHDYLAKLTLV